MFLYLDQTTGSLALTNPCIATSSSGNLNGPSLTTKSEFWNGTTAGDDNWQTPSRRRNRIERDQHSDSHSLEQAHSEARNPSIDFSAMSQETVAAKGMLARFARWQGRKPVSVAADTTYGNGEFLTSSRRMGFGPAFLPDPLSGLLAAVRRVHGLCCVFFNGYIGAERTHKLSAVHAEERLPRGRRLHCLLGLIVVNIGDYVGCQTNVAPNGPTVCVLKALQDCLCGPAILETISERRHQIGRCVDNYSVFIAILRWALPEPAIASTKLMKAFVLKLSRVMRYLHFPIPPVAPRATWCSPWRRSPCWDCRQNFW